MSSGRSRSAKAPTAPKIANGVTRITTKGSLRLSYCAARTRKIMNTPKAKMRGA